MKLFIGLMSGTSMDGIDAALVDIETNTLIEGITRPYGDSAKQCLDAVINDVSPGPAALSQLNTLLGREFSDAVFQLLETAQVSAQQVVAIGSHGQTICHDAKAGIPYTVQLGCAHTIAELTGIEVVADFRTRDLVIGGQGAPFAPIYHQALFGTKSLPLAVVNIGGIANLTVLSEEGLVRGYDTGPGNCLMDMWILKQQGFPYDKGGEWALTGRVIKPLLDTLLADPFFKCPPPKSLGKEYFSSTWLMPHLQYKHKPEDVQATLLALTAITIADAIHSAHAGLKQVAMCGGGVHNDALINALAKHLPNTHVISTMELGIDPDFMEAMMFAWLASKTVNKLAVDFKSITGSRCAAIYGAIYAAGIDKINSIAV